MYLATNSRPQSCVVARNSGSQSFGPAKTQIIAAQNVLRYHKNSKYLTDTESRKDRPTKGAYRCQLWSSSEYCATKSICILIKYKNVSVLATRFLQKSAALSSTEGEYLALFSPGPSIAWLQNVLNDLAITLNCAPIHGVETYEIDFVKEGPAKHISKRNHVDIRYNYVMELVKTRTMDLIKTKTSKNKENFLMTMLATSDFEIKLRSTKFLQNTQQLLQYELKMKRKKRKAVKLVIPCSADMYRIMELNNDGEIKGYLLSLIHTY